jgi:hypothetical protein
MNCADVRIIGGSENKNRITGQNIMIANFPGYPTMTPKEFPPGGPSNPGTEISHFEIH